MADVRITLTDVMLGIDKHGLVCKLSEESFTFLIGMILEHNKIGFVPGFDMTNSQAMAAGGGNTPKSVRRRRLTLSKFKINGKPLLKFTTGNYGRNTCAEYEINYESLLSYNGVWTKENSQPAQKWGSSGESGGRVEGTVEGTVPGPILRSDQNRGEKTTTGPIGDLDISDYPNTDTDATVVVGLILNKYRSQIMDSTPSPNNMRIALEHYTVQQLTEAIGRTPMVLKAKKPATALYHRRQIAVDNMREALCLTSGLR